jgi:cellulose synthase operon protein C
MKSTLIAKGQGAPEFRRAYQAANTRKATFEQAWAMSFPGLKVDNVTVSDVTRLEEPVKLEGSISTPRFAEALPGALRFYPFGAGRAFTQALAPLGSRKFDLVFSGVWRNDFHFNYTLPSGFEPVELFDDLRVDSPFGTLTLTAKMVDGKLKVDGALVLQAARVKAAEYPKFREWLLQVDQTFSRKLTVRRVGGQTAAR